VVDTQLADIAVMSTQGGSSSIDDDSAIYMSTSANAPPPRATVPAENIANISGCTLWTTGTLPPMGEGEAIAQKFDELTPEQLEAHNLEAVEQAQDEIVVDTPSDYSASDGGYESDSMRSAGTSLRSSVQNYAWENGRRYHRFREGAYNFPNDDLEQDREDMKHAMMVYLCQRLHFAPIGSNPQTIMDMGTGTGLWAIESEPFTLCTSTS
jgi:hypothetical protein